LAFPGFLVSTTARDLRRSQAIGRLKSGATPRTGGSLEWTRLNGNRTSAGPARHVGAGTAEPGADGKSARPPGLLDSCYAWRANGPVVQEFFPAHYRGQRQ